MDTYALIVHYVGLPPDPRTAKVLGRLVSLEHNGSQVKSPVHSLPELQIWLHAAGYRPDFSQWHALKARGRNATGSGRLEVWTREEVEEADQAEEPKTYYTAPPRQAAPASTAGLSEAELRKQAIYGAGARPAEYCKLPPLAGRF